MELINLPRPLQGNNLMLLNRFAIEHYVVFFLHRNTKGRNNLKKQCTRTQLEGLRSGQIRDATPCPPVQWALKRCHKTCCFPWVRGPIQHLENKENKNSRNVCLKEKKNFNNKQENHSVETREWWHLSVKFKKKQ